MVENASDSISDFAELSLTFGVVLWDHQYFDIFSILTRHVFCV